MSVESYPELYLAIFGWLQYDRLWELLTGTGLAYLPFLIILIQNIVDPLKSQEARDAGTTSVKRMQVDMLIAFTVVVIAAVPAITLSAEVVAYQKPCDTALADAGEYEAGDTGTTYDATFGDLISTPALVPVWWFGIMAISSGINQQAIANIGCTEDVFGVQAQIDSTEIHDPALANELQLFIQHCYLPAVSRFQREKPDISAVVADGEAEGLWPGSSVLIETEGLYDDLRPSEPIPGWSYDAARDTEYSPELLEQYDQANIGMPFCNDWWTNDGIGLRGKLIAVFEPSFMGKAVAAATGQFGFVGSQDDAEDELIKGLVRTTQAAAPAGDAFMPSLNEDGGILNVTARLAALGTALAEPAIESGLYTVRAAAPIFQALLLAGIYALLGLALIAGLYSLRSLLLLSVLVFTVKFWSYLWHVAWFLQQHLVEAMFNGSSQWEQLQVWVNGVTNGALSSNPNFGIKIAAIDFATDFLFIALPILFAVLMGAVGIGAVSALGLAFNALSNPTQQAGGQAASTGTSIATRGATRGVGR